MIREHPAPPEFRMRNIFDRYGLFWAEYSVIQAHRASFVYGRLIILQVLLLLKA